MTPEAELLQDPIKFTKLCWPDLWLYDKQQEIMESVRDNDETIVPAGNMLGKDFIAALIALWFYCSRKPAKVVTSSVDSFQLETVLWGEMRRFVQTSRYPLPIRMTHMLCHQKQRDGSDEPLSALIGRVAQKGEGMLGQHIAMTADGRPRTFMIFDEASAIEDQAYETSTTWAQRILVIGNPYPCENFFRKFVKEGDVKRPSGKGYYRKIIRIKAEDSPNVRYVRAQQAKGIKEEDLDIKIIIPGVISYPEYAKRRSTWDKIRQTISLDAEFYEGAEILLYPPEWLDRAARVAAALHDSTRRAKTMGVDTAEGGDSTVWTVIDEYGIIFSRSIKTVDTSVILGETIKLMDTYHLEDHQVLFDRGGGGKQHADYLRVQGYNVRTIAFGEAPTPNPDAQRKPGFPSNTKRLHEAEERYVYKNRRAEMYGLLRHKLLDPVTNEVGFGIPAGMTELRRQLSPIPLLYDGEGRLYLPPKTRPKTSESKIPTLTDLIGCSPDEADSLVLAVFGLYNKGPKRTLGAAF